MHITINSNKSICCVESIESIRETQTIWKTADTNKLQQPNANEEHNRLAQNNFTCPALAHLN